MTNIEKGDFVICLGSDFGSSAFIKGRLYKVKDILFDGTDSKFDVILIEKDSKGSTSNGWRRQNFKKLSNTELANILYE